MCSISSFSFLEVVLESQERLILNVNNTPARLESHCDVIALVLMASAAVVPQVVEVWVKAATLRYLCSVRLFVCLSSLSFSAPYS